MANSGEKVQDAERSKKLLHLRDLFKALPISLPTVSNAPKPDDPNQLRNVYSVFSSFQPDSDWLEKTDDLAGAVTKIFKLVFGWNAECDRELTFAARGKDVEAIVDVLQEYTGHPECQGNLAPLDLWIDRMIEMAKATHARHAGKRASPIVTHIYLPILNHCVHLQNDASIMADPDKKRAQKSDNPKGPPTAAIPSERAPARDVTATRTLKKADTTRTKRKRKDPASVCGANVVLVLDHNLELMPPQR